MAQRRKFKVGDRIRITSRQAKHQDVVKQFDGKEGAIRRIDPQLGYIVRIDGVERAMCFYEDELELVQK